MQNICSAALGLACVFAVNGQMATNLSARGLEDSCQSGWGVGLGGAGLFKLFLRL